MVFVAAISCNRTLRGYAGSQCSAFPAPKKKDGIKSVLPVFSNTAPLSILPLHRPPPVILTAWSWPRAHRPL